MHGEVLRTPVLNASLFLFIILYQLLDRPIKKLNAEEDKYAAETNNNDTIRRFFYKLSRFADNDRNQRIPCDIRCYVSEIIYGHSDNAI